MKSFFSLGTSAFGRKPPTYNTGGMGFGLFLNGLLCLFFGLAIFAEPDLVAYFVAAFLVVTGVSLLAAWWKMKKMTGRTW